ncbi:MAG TPA: hypothetical protein VMS76_19925 [Planctomycetota bacterium]|nr:hypothetical protein [Planctomycetota bacterium]
MSSRRRKTQEPSARPAAGPVHYRAIESPELVLSWLREDSEVAEGAEADAVLDTVADLAAKHPRLRSKGPLIRSLLAWEAELGSIALSLGGGPRRVLRAEDLASERQARLAGESMARIWEEEMLEPRAAAEALGAAATNRQKVADLRQRSVLVGLPHGNRYLYPAFQFDLARKRVRPVVAEVNQLLEAAEDPWGVASWWVSPNGWLGGERPTDLASTRRAGEVKAAAAAMLEPIG